MLSQRRYQVQRLNAVNVWEDIRGRRAMFGEDLVWRIERDVAKGARAEDFRIWDTETNQVYIPTPPYVPTEEELRAREERQAKWKAERDAERAIEQEEARLRYEQYKVEEAVAAESLATRNIHSVEDFLSLPEMERGLLVSAVADAYSSTDIDGYGDEGSGYDVDLFIQKLLQAGWTLTPPTSSDQ